MQLSVTNSALHSGKGIGMMSENSKFFEFKNNVIVDFVEHGIWVKTTTSAVIENTWVLNVIPAEDPALSRPTEPVNTVPDGDVFADIFDGSWRAP
jgi:hypothetical protein